jgi:hypothetical protein
MSSDYAWTAYDLEADARTDARLIACLLVLAPAAIIAGILYGVVL